MNIHDFPQTEFKMLPKLGHAGLGVAMGNAIEEVKRAADVVIGTNDEDGIADYLKQF